MIRSELTEAARIHAARSALWLKGERTSYEGLAQLARLMERGFGPKTRHLLICLPKTRAYYAGVWWALSSGRTYLPLNDGWNAARVAAIFERAAPDAALLSRAQAAALPETQKALYMEIAIAIGEDLVALIRRPETRAEEDGVAPDSAYVMFTSGSTGTPKGVMVSAANVSHYIAAMRERFQVSAPERWIQAVEMNFDLSVHDMLLAWSTGGEVISVPSGMAQMAPRFAKKLEVENWLAVPSAAAQAADLGLLSPGALPSIKRSFFCGEALPESLARIWASAAPNAPLWNIYGPTEATIAFSVRRFEPTAPSRGGAALVPIGAPLAGCQMRLDETGEILLGGPQVCPGYFKDAEKTAKAFFEREGVRWYRTGDLGAELADGAFDFQGRLDFQVKIRGARIELGEIEQAARAATGSELATVVAYGEIAPGAYRDIALFHGGAAPEAVVRTALTERLPRYMQPTLVVRLEDFPRNANGKIDRLALTRQADGLAAAPAGAAEAG